MTIDAYNPRVKLVPCDGGTPLYIEGNDLITRISGEQVQAKLVPPDFPVWIFEGENRMQAFVDGEFHRKQLHKLDGYNFSTPDRVPSPQPKPTKVNSSPRGNVELRLSGGWIFVEFASINTVQQKKSAWMHVCNAYLFEYQHGTINDRNKSVQVPNNVSVNAIMALIKKVLLSFNHTVSCETF